MGDSGRGGFSPWWELLLSVYRDMYVLQQRGGADFVVVSCLFVEAHILSHQVVVRCMPAWPSRLRGVAGACDHIRPAGEL